MNPEVQSQPPQDPSAPRQANRTEPFPFETLLFGPQGLRAGWRLLGYVAVAVVTFLVLGTIARHLPPIVRLLHSLQPGVLSPWAQLLNELLLAFSALFAAFVMGRYERRPLGAYGVPGRLAFGKLFWQGAAWGLGMISALVLLIRAFSGCSFNGFALAAGTAMQYGFLWACVFVLVGVFEEFLFRGYTQFTLASAIGFWPSALVLSAGFGAVHLRNPGEGLIGAASIFVIAIFFCLTLRRTGSLWFAIGAHASFDWGETFLYSAPNSGLGAAGHLLNASFHGPAWLTGGSIGPEGSVMMFLTMALSYLLFLRMYRKPHST